MQTQNWYLAKLVYSIEVNFGSNTIQFDEQLRLIEANNMAEAIVKAKLLGAKNEFESSGNNTNHVKWNFIDLLDIKLIDNFTDGMEICSKIEEHPEGQSFINYVKAKANNLEAKFIPQPKSIY